MRTTITINDTLFHLLKVRAAESDETVSQLIEEAVKFQMLEDFEDIEDAEKRQAEPAHAFDDLVAQFKTEGLL